MNDVNVMLVVGDVTTMSGGDDDVMPSELGSSLEGQ